MKKTLTRALGGLLLASPFLGLLVFGIVIGQLLPVLAGVGIAFALIGAITLGMHLLGH